ncbi:hypothetical protein F5B19DRAFT_232902 [Rostrohypoxylon terebratum]|nr:hypothetical protein F5B19DRAFT_232902 [Rostrohypoxylon terebratum]
MSTSSPLKEGASIEYRTDRYTDDFIDLDSLIYLYSLGPSASLRALLNKPRYNSSLSYPFQQFGAEKMVTNTDFDPLLHGWGVILDKNKAKNMTRDDYERGLNADLTELAAYSEFEAPVFRTWAPFLGNKTIGFYKARNLPHELVPNDTRLPDPVLQKFFIESMDFTNSPASSLSGLLTVLSAIAYYELSPLFRKSGTGVVTEFEVVTYPQSWSGLTTVVALLTAHFLVCMVILRTYLTKTRLTRLGSSWSSVAQMHSAGTKALVQDGTLASDDEVKKYLSEKGRAQRLVRLSLVGDGDNQRCEPIFVQGEDK